MADKEEEIEGPSAVAQPISSATHLDSKTVELLSGKDSFYIQQRIRWIEAVTQGCWEQPNIYDIFDKDTNKRIFIIKEESEIWSRCCCSPDHSMFLKFYHLDENAPETAPGQKTDWSYEPSGPAFMTMEREGCDCCCAPCPKPCLCCFACTPGCSNTSTLHAGDLTGDPGSMKGNREKTKLLGESVQPIGGGGFKPVMQLMDRGSGSSDDAEMFAATRGPCFFGGCSELCFDTHFGLSVAQPGMSVSQIHKLPFGDFASIEKKKPASMSQAAREFFTDADIYEVHFHSKSLTPQQKANVLATMVHLDYMFFERDNDMCYCDGDGLHITFCNCFVYGCVCPCRITLNNNNGGGD